VATTNGTTWTSQTVGSNSNTFYAITCASATACWAAGGNGVIYASTNGTTWTAQTSGTTEDIWGLDCISTTQCWANGSTTAGSAGVVLVTTNGGATWFSPACAQYLQWTFAPVVAAGAPVTSAVLTLVDDASATPSGTTATYVLVSANAGSTWTPFSIANPTTTLATQTLSINSVISSATAVSGMEIRYLVTGSNAFKSTFDLVHVNINCRCLRPAATAARAKRRPVRARRRISAVEEGAWLGLGCPADAPRQDPQLLDHRPHRPRQVHPGRPAAGAHRHGGHAGHAGPGSRHPGPGA
jgi:hypothetical protein